MTAHPAKFSKGLMPVLASALVGCHTVLDPFAGTGRIHELNGYSVDQNLTSKRGRDGANVINLDLEITAIELEPEWIEKQWEDSVIVGDCFDIMKRLKPNSFDAVCTSPTYGNRMADKHDARDGSRRNTYKHTLGRPLTSNNSGGMQWGDEYRDFHRRFLEASWELLRPGGRCVINIKNHIRDGEEMRVTEWFQEELSMLGFLRAAHYKVETPGQRHGANGKLRIPYESVLVYFKPMAAEEFIGQVPDLKWREHVG